MALQPVKFTKISPVGQATPIASAKAGCRQSCCSGEATPASTSHTPGNPSIPPGSSQSRLLIAQMDCPTEETLIRKALGGMSVVQGLEFNLMARVLTVVHTQGQLPAIEAAIRTLGMDSVPVKEGDDGAAMAAPAGKPWWPLVLAGAAALGAEAVSWLGWSVWLGAALALSAIAISGLGT